MNIIAFLDRLKYRWGLHMVVKRAGWSRDSEIRFYKETYERNAHGSPKALQLK